jgi:enamine deaminase RidA (YjgF/YER057c/UK114 family)
MLLRQSGGVRERPNRHDWKSCDLQGSMGSNPISSAEFEKGSGPTWDLVEEDRVTDQAQSHVRLVRSEALASRAPYAYAAVVEDARRIVFTAGACPLDEDGNTVCVGDFAGQASRCVENLEIALGAAGASLTDVVKTTIYVASGDQKDLVVVWNVVRAAFGDHDAPSTLIGVTVLGYDDQLVEIEAIAATD